MILLLNNLDSELSKINAWANHLKMSFNPDFNKQEQEVFLVKQKRILFSLNFKNIEGLFLVK